MFWAPAFNAARAASVSKFRHPVGAVKENSSRFTARSSDCLLVASVVHVWDAGLGPAAELLEILCVAPAPNSNTPFSCIAAGVENCFSNSGARGGSRVVSTLCERRVDRFLCPDLVRARHG